MKTECSQRKFFPRKDLIEHCLNSNITTEEADELLSEFMIKHKIKKKKGILAGNLIGIFIKFHIFFINFFLNFLTDCERQFLDRYCPKFVSHLHHRMVDVSSIKVLINMSNRINIGHYSKAITCGTLDNIGQNIEELKYFRLHFFKN